LTFEHKKNGLRAASEHVALLLPQSPSPAAQPTNPVFGAGSVEGSGGGGREDGRAAEKGGSGRDFRGEGEGVAGRGGGRGSGGGNVLEQDVHVFADTLGMQGGGVAVTEVLRNTFPPPRNPLAPLVPGKKKHSQTSKLHSGFI